MTTTQISKKAARAMTKFEIAKQIRELLDAAKKAYGATEWTDEDLEGQILELVTEEG